MTICRLVQLPEEATRVLGLGLFNQCGKLVLVQGELVRAIVLLVWISRSANFIANICPNSCRFVSVHVEIHLLLQSARAVIRTFMELLIVTEIISHNIDTAGI